MQNEFNYQQAIKDLEGLDKYESLSQIFSAEALAGFKGAKKFYKLYSNQKATTKNDSV